MCNDYGNRIPYSAYVEAFSDLKIPIFAPGGPPNLEPRDDIWPTDIAPIVRIGDNRAELVQLRWGFPAARPKGPPIINMRSEKRRFARGRCLIPASHFYEFVGKKYPKAKYRFSLKGSPITGIAGIWREGQGNQPPSFAMLTTAPGEDIAPYHNRQVVVLKPKDWPGWLQLTSPEAELLRPLPKGTLNVELVREGSD